MATSITSQPAAFGLCKNPNQMVFGLQSDQYLSVIGTAISGSMTSSANPSAGETLIFTIAGITDPVTFEFVAGAPGTPLEVTVGANKDETLENIYNAIIAHYELSSAYTWELFAGAFLSIEFTAFENGSDFQIVMTGTAAGDYAIPQIGGIDEVIQSDLKIIADLWVKTGSEFYKELARSLTPDDSGSTEIDIHRILLSFLFPEKPSFNQATSSLVAGPVVEYKLRHTDYYADAYHQYEDTGSYIAILAGYPEKNLGTQQFASQYFTNTADRKFLTQIPRSEGLKVPNDCPAYLYMWANTSDTYRLGVKFSYTDGTDSYAYNILNRATGSRMVCWPIGYDLLDLDSVITAGKTLRYYEVFVIIGATIGAATNTTEFFKVVPDTAYHEKKTYFMFLNSLGGMDTVFFNGDVEKNVEVEGDSVQIYPVEHDEDNTYGEFLPEIKTFTNPHTYFSGYKSQSTIDYLQDLLKSEFVWLIDESQYIEMKVDTNSARLYSLNDFQYSIEVEMTPAQINRGYAQ